MKIDYLKQQKLKPKRWWKQEGDKKSQEPFFKELLANPEQLGPDFAALNLSQQQVIKNSLLEFLPFDYQLYQKEGRIQPKEQLLLAYFNSGETGRLYFN
jgi:hypothetical protein